MTEDENINEKPKIFEQRQNFHPKIILLDMNPKFQNHLKPIKEPDFPSNSLFKLRQKVKGFENYYYIILLYILY